MTTKKVNVTALRPFSHANIDAREGGVYAMNAGDARELQKAGFVTLDADGEAESAQIDQPAQKPQPGDVVADDAPDILGAKMDDAVENKMANAAENKRRK